MPIFLIKFATLLIRNIGSGISFAVSVSTILSDE